MKSLNTFIQEGSPKSCPKGQYYCFTDKKCKKIPGGYFVGRRGYLEPEEDSENSKKNGKNGSSNGNGNGGNGNGNGGNGGGNGGGMSEELNKDDKPFVKKLVGKLRSGSKTHAKQADDLEKAMKEESNPRIPRKKGQPANSKKHSDLYTDENPKGTIQGLGFKDVDTAKSSVSKIRSSSRSHAHKIQAAVAMEQRAREMGKTSEAAVYRKFINTMKKKTKKMNEEKHGDHEPEMIRSQLKTAGRASKRIEKHSRKKDNFKAWVQSKITKASDYLDTAADYLDSKDMKKEAANPAQQAAIAINMKEKGKKPKEVSEGSLRKWFKGSKSKDGKGGWVNVVTGGTCASDEPGEGTPKCVSSSKRASMTKAERLSASRRKKKADPGQQSKTGAAKPTYVSTDKPKKKMKEETDFINLPLQLEVPQTEGEFKLGLMFRESLEQDRGMLFIFENPDRHSFHMKNTSIPLDIAFIKEDGTIDSIKELNPNSSIAIYPDNEIVFAVEVNRGWFAENDVNVGDALIEDQAEVITEVKDKKGKGSGSKDACYHKVKSRYSVWPSAYASGALVKCRKVGAANWGNKSEEVEVVNEVSKKTLGSYVKKASTEIGTSAIKGDYKKMQKRHKGVLDATDKMTKEEVIPEAKVDKGRSDYGKASIRNYRRMGPGHGDPGMFDPSGKRGKTIEKRREEHKSRRGVKGAKVPAYKVDEGSSYGLYKGSGKAKGAMKDFLDKKAKMLTKKRNAQSDAAKNNPHFDSTQPSPSGRNKYEQMSFQQFQEKCWAGYEKKGMKTMFGKRYPNCVKKKK